MVSESGLGPVREELLRFAASVPPEALMPTLEPDATRLVAEDPFAFSLAVVLDGGARAEIIWTIPFWLRQDLGHLNSEYLAQMTEQQISEALSRIPKKPRYMNDAPRTIFDLARLVYNDFGGNAELIWRGKTAHQVKHEFRSIHGVGEGIASMAVILLERCWHVQFPDQSVMDVKPDVHVQRVLYRLGVAQRLSEAKALRAAAALNPDYPGEIDPALWIIGRQWCSETAPNCTQCCMNQLCEKREIE